MDPLTVAASTVPLINTIGKVTSALTEQFGGGRELKSSFNRPGADLLSELNHLRLVLEQLSQLERQANFAGLQNESTKARIAKSLLGCQEALEKLEQKLTTGAMGRKRAFKSLTWNFRQRDIEGVIQDLNTHQKDLRLLITFQLIQATQHMSTQLKSQTSPIDIPKSGLLSPQELSSDEKILDWLTTYDYKSRHHELRRVRARDTGSWFLESEQFKGWLNIPFPGRRLRVSNVLWCYGAPGSGKSVLMATAIDHMISQANNDHTIGVAYFFFDYKTKATIRDVISCLLKQLCILQNFVPRSLRQLYERYDEGELSRSWETIKAKKGPETGELFASLQDVAACFKRTLICIDGLDECAPEFQNSLCELLRRIMKSRCRLLATSRPEHVYSELFHGKPSVHVEASSDDVRAYVRRVLDNRPEVRDMVDKRVENQIATCLTDKSNGLFLYVYLSMQSLLEQTSVTDLKEVLESLPFSLDEMYNDILKRIRDQSPRTSRNKLAMSIFRWLSYCERPLNVAELQHAVAVDPNYDADDLDRDRIPPMRFFEDVCMDLVSIDEERQLVLLAHVSLSKFLDEHRPSLFPHGLRDVAYSMLTYIHFTEFASGPCQDHDSLRSRLNRYPLSTYVARHWGDHVKDYWQGRVPKAIMQFLSSAPRRMAFVQLMHTSNSQESRSLREYPMDTSALHLVAYFGLNIAAKWILQDDDGPLCAQAVDSWERTPLHSACERCRSDEVVVQLLEQSAPVDALDRNGQAAIHLAASFGSVSIVLKLLSNGADPTRVDNFGRSAFDYAAAENHPKVLQELLNHSPDSVYSEGNALLAAATAGHSAVVELLLDNGIEHQEVEALHAAARLGFEEIVKILLERGTDINSIDSDSMTALHYACASGRTSMAKLLLANGSKVTSTDRDGRTALFLAAERGDEATLRVLTEYGAEIEARNVDGKTALWECAEKGNFVGVDFLLKRGATVSSSSSSEPTINGEIQENALQIAARNGHEAVVRLLLEKYTDTQGTAMRSVLSYAAEGGQLGVTNLLLETGIDVNVRDDAPEGRTPLTYAVQAGELDVARLLVDHGAMINMADSYGRTPLFYAIRGDQCGAVRFLLDHGADPNWRDDSQTPLIHAVQHGDAQAVRLLLEAGADPNLVDSQNNNASYYALESKNEAILAFLEKPDSLRRASTIATHGNSNTQIIKPSFLTRTSATKEFFRSQSDTGPRPRSFKASDGPSYSVIEQIPIDHIPQERLEAQLRERFPEVAEFNIERDDGRYKFVVPHYFTRDEKQNLVEALRLDNDDVL